MSDNGTYDLGGGRRGAISGQGQGQNGNGEQG